MTSNIDRLFESSFLFYIYFFLIFNFFFILILIRVFLTATFNKASQSYNLSVFH